MHLTDKDASIVNHILWSIRKKNISKDSRCFLGIDRYIIVQVSDHSHRISVLRIIFPPRVTISLTESSIV